MDLNNIQFCKQITGEGGASEVTIPQHTPPQPTAARNQRNTRGMRKQTYKQQHHRPGKPPATTTHTNDTKAGTTRGDTEGREKGFRAEAAARLHAAGEQTTDKRGRRERQQGLTNSHRVDVRCSVYVYGVRYMSTGKLYVLYRIPYKR